MTTRLNFTKASLTALPPAPDGKLATYYDTKVGGLMLLITSRGAKTFYVYRRINGRPERVKLGRFPEMTVDLARLKAHETNGAIAAGQDPAAAKRESRAALTFGELFEWYMNEPKKTGPRSAKTELEYRKQFRLHLTSMAGKKPAQISEREVEALIRQVGRDGGPYMANRVLALVRAVFNRAIRKGLIKGHNPATGVEPFMERSRDRRLMPHEVERFLAAVADEPNDTVRDYVLLSLYTGARKANVLAMRWEQIDFAGRTWCIPRTKNGTAQTVPLEDAELELLSRRRLAAQASSSWVFPGNGQTGHLADPKSGWRRILDRAEIEDLRLHDLRRSLASFMVDSGASLPVVGKALNHQSQATTAIYARLSLDPIRQAKRAAHGAMLASVTSLGSNPS